MNKKLDRHLVSAKPVHSDIVIRTVAKLGHPIPQEILQQGKEFRKWLGMTLTGSMMFFILKVEKPDNPYYVCMGSVKNQKIMEERNYLMTIFGQECCDYLYLTSLRGQAGVRFTMKSNGSANDFVVNSKDDLRHIAEFLLQHCNVG